MYLYNTLSRKKELFKPVNNNKVALYTCGPTVYDFSHIGNLRTFIFEDVLKRTLDFNGYSVRHIMNLTDVDDKTIKKSLEQKEPLNVFTGRYTKSFKEDIKELNIIFPKKFAPATLYIKEMVKIIKKLEKEGIAYEKDGSFYFKIKKFKNYGRLSGLENRELKTGATVDVDEYDKENPADFVLWKAWTEKDGPVFWKNELGKGRPGWHIECSAIANKLLGPTIDIHAGAVDLIFPHHENEIAQSEAVTGKKFVKFWVHGEHLLVDGQKMSKSLKNFYTLNDIKKKGFLALAFRYFCLQAHYRSKLNFTWEALDGAGNALKKIWAEARQLPKPKGGCGKYEKEFSESISDDLNTPEALASLWEMLKSDCPAEAKSASLLKFDKVLGLDIKKYLNKKIKIPKEILELARKREDARKNKNWKEADRLRKRIGELGFEIEDTKNGPKFIAN